MEINTIDKLIERIEWFGLIKCGKYKGYIKLNDKQWNHIKSEITPEN